MYVGVECLVHQTEYAGHAHELVANMSLQDLEAIDGILAVRLQSRIAAPLYDSKDTDKNSTYQTMLKSSDFPPHVTATGGR